MILPVFSSIENTFVTLESNMHSGKFIFIALTFVATVYATAISRSQYHRTESWGF